MKLNDLMGKVKKVGQSGVNVAKGLTGSKEVAQVHGMIQRKLPPEHHSNPTEYYGSGDVDAVSDGGGPLQIIEEGFLEFDEGGPDQFQMEPDLEWPGVKTKQRPRRQAY